MNYETFRYVVERTSRVKITDAQIILERLYNEADQSQDAIDAYSKILDLTDLIMKQENFIGDSSDFHNIAVVCARQEDFDIACRFLDKGLVNIPKDVDLLADYIKYGLQCNRETECAKAYTTLSGLRNSWNWRAYSFSVDYLTELSARDGTDRSREIIDIIREYQKKLPDVEDAYLAEAEFLQEHPKASSFYLDSNVTYVDVLERALSKESPVKRTPKCDLKLADYYYDSGKDMDKVITLLEKCKEDSAEIQPVVNRTYVYLLMSLSYMTKYYQALKNGDQDGMRDAVIKAYRNYHVAAAEPGDSRVIACRKLIENLARESETAYPYDDNVRF